MSWRDYEKLITDNNIDPLAWMSAKKGNPNTPEGALKWAIRECVLNTSNETTLDNIVKIILGLARNAAGLQLMINDLNDWFRDNPDFDLHYEPEWYERFYKLVSNTQPNKRMNAEYLAASVGEVELAKKIN